MFGSRNKNRGSDKCDRLGIRVYGKKVQIRLQGNLVNDISNVDPIKVFESLGWEVKNTYGGLDVLGVGVDAMRWENSDAWIDSYCVFEVEPKNPSAH